MSAQEFWTCLTIWPVGFLLACIALATRAVWQRQRRPPMHYRAGYDATHPLPDVAPRVVPPVETRPENPMRDTLVVARPARLWWDTTERKEY